MERGGGRAFFFPAGDFFFLLARLEVLEDEGRCQEAATCCSSPGAPEAAWLRPASERELETPELTPEVEWCDWWPDTLEIHENPDWVDCREVMEPL